VARTAAVPPPTARPEPAGPAAIPSLQTRRLPGATPGALSVFPQTPTRTRGNLSDDRPVTGTGEARIVNLVERRRRATLSVPAAPDGKKAAIDKTAPPASWTPESLSVTRLRAQLQLAHDELAALRNREQHPEPHGLRSPSPSPFELARLARGEVIRAFLPIIDDVERACDECSPRPNEDSVAIRLQRISQDLRDLLERQGVERIGSSRVLFDPQRHEVVGYTCDPAVPSHTVTAVHRPGYGLHGRILRRARVQVSTTHKVD